MKAFLSFRLSNGLYWSEGETSDYLLRLLMPLFVLETSNVQTLPQHRNTNSVSGASSFLVFLILESPYWTLIFGERIARFHASPHPIHHFHPAPPRTAAWRNLHDSWRQLHPALTSSAAERRVGPVAVAWR